MNDFLSIYNEKKSIIESYIEKIFSDSGYPQKNLLEIMKYSVMNGGKRIRPVLMTASYEIFSEDESKVLPFCAAIEMIHSYSLVHDDLPAMDNDSLRRGKPTAHVKFSYYGAILAGDALLNMAFETMLNVKDFGIRELTAMRIIANASGAYGMCAGQMTDMEGSISDFEELSVMCGQKTGALLKAAVTAGAVLGGASDAELKKLERYSEYLGLIFQIRDDILDITSTDEIIGKNVKSDEKNHKITFAEQYGLKKSEELLREYKEKSVILLKEIDGKTEFLEKLTEYMAERIN